MAPLTHRGEELRALLEQTFGFLRRGRHLANRFEDVFGTEVEAAVELLDRAVNLIVGETRIGHRALLIAVLIEQRIDREEAILLDVVVKLGAGIRRRERYLDGLAIHFARELHRLLDGVLGLAREAPDEGAVDEDSNLMAIAGEAARAFEPDALLDVLENLCVAGFVSDHEQAQPAVLHDLERFVI